MQTPLPSETREEIRIDAPAAARFSAIKLEASPWLHEEVGRRMAERLSYILREPAHWVDWHPSMGGIEAHRAVATRYPNARVSVVEPNAARQQFARAATRSPWWQRLRQPQAAWDAPADGSAQMVWANMGLHLAADPNALLATWQRWLAVDGFLMFCCMGPDTLRELRDVYRAAGWPPPHHPYVDMHDWGDALVRAGFAEPVMDVERIELTYSDASKALAELRTLGRNLHPQRFNGLRTPRWREQLVSALNKRASADADGHVKLTFEIIYGHAFKPVPRQAVTAEQHIRLEDMQSMLRRGK